MLVWQGEGNRMATFFQAGRRVLDGRATGEGRLLVNPCRLQHIAPVNEDAEIDDPGDSPHIGASGAHSAVPPGWQKGSSAAKRCNLLQRKWPEHVHA